MSARNEKLLADIGARFGDRVTATRSHVDEVTVEVPVESLVEVATALRDEDAFRFEQCMDVCGVDYLGYGQDEWVTDRSTATGFSRGVDRDAPAMVDDRPRFAVVYHLLSVATNRRLRLRTYCADDTVPRVPTLTGVWPSVNWFEREAFDLYGILFDGHPDLRRILTDYGFVGNPFRKDFPLIGNVEVRYDPEQARVVYQPVSIEPRTLVPKVIRSVPAGKGGAGA